MANFKLAPHKEIDALDTAVILLLRVLGFEPEDVLLTDESRVWDFTAFEDETSKTDILIRLTSLVGAPVTEKDTIVDLATKICNRLDVSIN